MARLDHWIACAIGERPYSAQQLHRYAFCHVIRRFRGRLGGTCATRSHVLTAQRIIKAAIALLDWLNVHDLILAARQGDLEAWLPARSRSPQRRGELVR